MKILFISRAYPPIVGGIENQNFELEKWLGKIADITIIANKKGKNFLPFFLPYAIIKSLFIARKYDAILLGDGVLGIVGWFIKLFYRKPVICIVHGLDITYKDMIYQKFWVNIFLRKIDKLISVGNETIKVANLKGLCLKKLVFIPNGVDIDRLCKNHTREELEKIIGTDLKDKKVILRVGRFVKHKGVEWFISNVIPKLPENYILIAAGGVPRKNAKGDENLYQKCREAIKKNKLENRVRLISNIPQNDLEVLFNTADLIISPNIKVPGSMEGFGINAIEGASCKKVVLASNLEGLKDAIIDRENGFLVEPENIDAWTAKIKELLSNDAERKAFGEKARQFVIDNFRWEIIAQKYLEEIKKTLNA